eukprot:TRINITY_DN43_c0_g2_i8.p1 TRINITY_DN43_c0_g2~~TRINITY_DN43_c0_g2_i8.p1  ORF type:complete len:334 (+),score=81.77 TRINITY_DN43_c0_g2_i8:175-1176(+)
MSNSSGNSNSKPMSFTLGTKRPNAQVKALFADDGDDDVQQQSQPKTQSQAQAQAQIQTQIQVPTPQQSILQDATKSQDERDLSSSAPKEKRSRWGQAVVEDNSPSGGPQTTPQPPIDPEIVKVIEKTAEYVSRAGPSLEAVIRTKQQENPQFRFLFDESLPEAFFYRSKLQQLTSQQQISSPNSTVSSVESGSPASRTMPSGRVSKFSSVPPPGYTPTPMQTAKPQTYVPPPALPASSNVGASETFKEEDEEDEGSDEEAQLAKYQRILEAYKRQQPPPKKQETPGMISSLRDFVLFSFDPSSFFFFFFCILCFDCVFSHLCIDLIGPIESTR